MNVPKLRFKDDDGRPFPEWESNLLGSYAEAISSGKSNARNGNGRYILYGSTGSIGYADDYDYQGEKLLIARVGANAGYLYRVEGDYCVSDNTLMLTLKQPHNYSFFFNLLTKKNLNKLVFGSGQPLITGGHLKNLEVSVPSLPEQTKIANFLTAVDEKVTQLTQKSDLLAQYKKGVMQKVFSQELRFKDDDGRKFPEWKEVLLGDVASFIKGKGISKADIDDEGITPCIRYGELYTEYGETIREVKSKTNIDIKNLVLSEANDVIIPASGETQIDIATASCVQLSGVALGGDLNIIKSQENGVFLSYYLNNQKKLDIAKLAQGNSVVHLYSSQLKQLNIKLPIKSEQTKIADFLTAIDDKVTQTKAELDAVKQYKQGLLQQMFI